MKQLEERATQEPQSTAPELIMASVPKLGPQAAADESLLEAPHWKQDNIVGLQQKWVQSLQRIKDCCTAQPAQLQGSSS